MAPQKSPAFQFYAQDFLTGTASMSLQEVGAYIRLLAHEWHAGSIPADANERARLLGCAKSQERELWKKVGKKFVLKDDAYFNERLEDERQKQTEYRRRQSDRGKASAASRRHYGGNAGSTSVATPVQPAHQPGGNRGGNQTSTLQSSSSSSGSGIETGSPTMKHRGGVIVGPAEYARAQEIYAFVGSRLKVPHKLHAELLDKSGGPHRERDLKAWYLDLNDSLEENDKGPGDVFEFLRPRHQSFAKLRGWVEDAPKANGAKRDDAAQLARLQAIERGERAR